MGSTRKFSKPVGRDAEKDGYRSVLLTCGHTTEREPTISSPAKKWFCCGEYRKAKSGR